MPSTLMKESGPNEADVEEDLIQISFSDNCVSLLNSVLKHADIQAEDTVEAVVYTCMPEFMKTW